MWDIDYYIDFYNFLELLTINDSNVLTIKNNILNIMDTAVIANKHLPTDPAHGLSIYFPRRTTDYNNSLRYEVLPSSYEETLFAIDTQWNEFLKIYLGITNNQPPTIPELSGPEKGSPGVNYNYTVRSTDVDYQGILYYIDWGDGTNTGWIGPFSPGEEIIINHTYTKKGTYTIKAKAKDVLNAESDWATLEVKIPRIRSFASSRIILIGKISYLEKTEEGNFRFLPIKVLEITKLEGQQKTIKILNETYGEYPCCGYIQKEYCRGLVRENFIAILWTF